MFSIRSREAYRTRNVIVEAIADYERKRCASQALMTSPRLADPPPSGRFSAVDPEFHSLGTSSPGIAGAFEGESLAHSLRARSAENGDPGTGVSEPLEAAEYAFISCLPLLGLLDT